jgi:Fe-S oxidoreductase
MAQKKRTYTSAFEGARTLGHLLAPPGFKWEIELPRQAEEVPLVLHISCNAHFTIFVPYLAEQILKRLGVEFLIMGGPENCCGSIHKNLGDVDLEGEVATKTLLHFKRAKPKTVLSFCPDCDEVFEKYKLQGKSFYHSNVSELFLDYVEQLRPLLKPVRKRVVMHWHDVNEQRQRDSDRALALIKEIPGLEIIPAEHAHGPGIHCQTVHPMPPADQARMFDEARRLGADVLVVPYHSCYRQHVKMQLEYGVETHHYFSLLAMSLGIDFDEPFKRLRLLNDVDRAIADLRPKISAMGYQEDIVRSYVERAIYC